MKCLCGYEYEEGIDSYGKWGVLVGDDKFRKIKGHFILTPSKSWEDEKVIPLFACPKCGTVKMDLE